MPRQRPVERRKNPRPLPPAVPLPLGTRIGRGYEVRNVLGSGPFGIVYRVHDDQHDEDLAVKEYLPNVLAVREGALQVAPRAPEEAETFALALRFFNDEAGLLERFDLPGLIKVHEHWAENGTAYMAMPLVTGRTLFDTVQARWKPPREPQLRALLDLLLATLEQLHKSRVQHRDICPQTVVLMPDGRPMLMDMGAPRRVTTSRGDIGPTGPRDGFAPPELYQRDLARGPWTDLYALAATMHFLIGGRAPPAAPQRKPGDAPAMQLLRPDMRHSLDLLAVLDWMLAPDPAKRPRSVAEVRAALDGGPLPEAFRPTPRLRRKAMMWRHRRWIWGAVGVVLVLAGAALARWMMTSPSMPWNAEPPSATKPAGRPQR